MLIRIIVTALVTVLVTAAGYAQNTDVKISQAADSVCKCLSNIRMDTVSAQHAEKLLVNCFLKTGLEGLMGLVTERGLAFSDKKAMEALGQEIAKEMIARKCEPFLQLAIKMAGNEEEAPIPAIVHGTVKQVTVTDIVQLKITEPNGRERTLYWLGYIKNAEAYTNNPKLLERKKLSFTYQQREIYLPQAKGYFPIMEITAINE